MWSLVLSRSRRHGLRNDQPCIAFTFHDDGMDIIGGSVTNWKDALDEMWQPTDEEHRATFPTIALTPEIEDMLKRLAAKPIN
jgi:hypothetical protein